MTEIEDFLTRLSELDVKLWVDDGKLRCNAPQQVLTPELKEELAARKADLLAFFSINQIAVSKHSIASFPRDNKIPLTLGQERIWSLAKLEPGSSVYNVPMVFMLDGPLDKFALERSLTEIQRRHEILRTSFPGEDLAEVRQMIHPEMPLVLHLTPIGRDIRKLPSKQVKRAINSLLQIEVRRPFDLNKGPLWRVNLFRLGKNKHVLVFTMHHIIFDGVSKTVFLDELARIYRAFAADEPTGLQPPPVQFADFAGWQRGRLDEGTLQRQLSYWSKRLEGDVPELIIPNDQPRIQGKRRAGHLHFELPVALTDALVALGRSEQASVFVTLLTAFNVLLNRFSGQEDLLVCSPTASREHVDLEGLIGYFNNIVVMRGDLSGNPSFRELIARMRRLAVDAYDNQNVPLQHLAQLPNLVRTPLTRAMFSFQDASSRRLELPGIEAIPMSIRKDAADFDLAMYTESDGGKITGVLDYNADLFAEKRLVRFLQAFSRVLNRAVKEPDKQLDSYPSFGRKVADIEQLLTKHAQIDQAVLVPSKHFGKLFAYLVLNEYDVPSLEAVRAYACSVLPDYRVPVAFIPVDEMPLLPDGQIDQSALPAPSFDRGQLDSHYVAPRNELEQRLAEIWKKVLWLDHDVGIYDSFSDLGGHSLLSVQLVIEIEQMLQRRVSAKALSSLNTIAELAVALEEKGESDSADGVADIEWLGKLPKDIYYGLRSYTSSWKGERATSESVIVGLNSNGKKQALFWCLQRYQELTQLAKYLGSEQPVYGMRSGNRVMAKTQDNINLLAAHYVDEILGIQPQGPYLIGGNCQAAQIAFQVAKQLNDLGHEITLLFLMEKFVPFAYRGSVALLFGEQSERNPYLRYHKPKLGWTKYYSGLLDMKLIPGGHGQFFREPNIQGLSATIKDYIEQAQTGTFSSFSVLPESDRGCQILPNGAYRAKLIAPIEYSVKPNQEFAVTVDVTNISECAWQPTQESGIILAGRWLDKQGKVYKPVDGRAVLTETLNPGITVKLHLTVCAPADSAHWILELDLVDEGITCFKDQGSVPFKINITVH